MLLLDGRMSIIKRGILATPQSTLTTSNQSSFKSNLQPLCKLLSSSFLLFIQLQSLIWIPYTEISFQLSLVIQLLQNISSQMADDLQTQTVFFFLIIEFIYYLLIISVHMFSSITMTTSLPDTLVKTKHWNQFIIDISSPAFVLMYNSSASPVLLVYDPSHNITSSTDLSNNFLFLNDHGIPFLQTSLRNSYHFLNLTLSQLQLTGSPNRQSLFLPMIPSHLFILYLFSKHSVPFYVTSNRGSEFISNFFYSLDIALDMWLYFTSGYHSEGDGQTECMNQTLEQYLYVYCNYQQDNLFELLLLVEFSYNNVSSTTTGVSTFFVNKIYHPNITVHPKCNIASFQAYNFAINLNELQSTLKAKISMV